MQFRSRFGAALVASGLLGFATGAEARALMVAAPPKPGALAGQSDVVVIGKVIEVEKDVVEATAFKGAPKGEKVAYKIAVIKIEEAIIGGKGLTQFRVGFPEGAAAGGTPVPPPPPGGGLRIRPGGPGGRGMAPVALTAGTEGVFFLSQHHDGDFYILAYNGMAAPLNKKDENFKKELEAIKKVAKTIDDPVTALKAKELDDRYAAATMILQRYNQSRTGGTAREAIPAEENKLIVALMLELPWQPKLDQPRTGSDPVPPSRSQLWYMINPNEQGFKQPVIKPAKPGEPQPDYNKIMDEATGSFLKDNAAKIKIKRFVK